jgi:hypothetical protein
MGGVSLLRFLSITHTRELFKSVLDTLIYSAILLLGNQFVQRIPFHNLFATLQDLMEQFDNYRSTIAVYYWIHLCVQLLVLPVLRPGRVTSIH